MPIKPKQDKNAINNVNNSIFKKNRKTTRITPKSNIIYDIFLII